jgi:wobble nucleotide-excising tRNase
MQINDLENQIKQSSDEVDYLNQQIHQIELGNLSSILNKLQENKELLIIIDRVRFLR